MITSCVGDIHSGTGHVRSVACCICKGRLRDGWKAQHGVLARHQIAIHPAAHVAKLKPITTHTSELIVHRTMCFVFSHFVVFLRRLRGDHAFEIDKIEKPFLKVIRINRQRGPIPKMYFGWGEHIQLPRNEFAVYDIPVDGPEGIHAPRDIFSRDTQCSVYSSVPKITPIHWWEKRQQRFFIRSLVRTCNPMTCDLNRMRKSRCYVLEDMLQTKLYFCLLPTGLIISQPCKIWTCCVHIDKSCNVKSPHMRGLKDKRHDFL